MKKSIVETDYIADEIDFIKLFEIVWRGRVIVVLCATIFAVSSVVFALLNPSIYKSEVLLAPADDRGGQGLSGVSGPLGGLAGLAGISLGSSDKSHLTIEVLKSRAFITKFIENHNLLPPLLAAKGWDQSAQKLIFDNEIYDSETGQWLKDGKPDDLARPSLLKGYGKFIKILSVSVDHKSKFVRIGIQYFSPELAKQWVDLLVKDINNEIKVRDIAEAKKSVEFLTVEARETSVSEIRVILFELVEEHMKTILFAEIREGYVFEVIDPPVIPERKVKPKRSLIAVLGTLLGVGLGVLIVVFQHIVNVNKKKKLRDA